MFLTLVRSGQLKIDYISDVEFFFLQIPDYIFTVKHYERESMNVGWLISSLIECSEIEKDELLVVLRHNARNSKKESDLSDGLPERSDINKQEASVDSILSNQMLPLSQAEKIVRRFGNLISLWCETGDLDYKKKAINECNGKKGKKCFVKDDLMIAFATVSNLSNDSLYSLNSYVNSIMFLLKRGNISFKLSDIKEIDTTEDFYIISCNISILGDVELKSRDKILVSKSNNKITLITSLADK